MPLTLEQLQEIQSDALADDVQIDFEKMSLWTVEQATEYFDSGGTVEPSSGPPPPPPPLGRKPRVALLHGTAGNEKVFGIQLMALMQKLKPAAESISTIEGRQVIAKDNPQAASILKAFGDDQILREYATVAVPEDNWRYYPEVNEALSYLEGMLSKLPGGSADVLVGFSQGSAMISMLAAIMEQRGTPFRCVILLSPLLPGYVKQRPELFKKPLSTPCFIGYAADDPLMYNDKKECGPDEVAKLWMSERVTKRVHGGPGHRPLPADKVERVTVAEEIVALIERSCILP